MGMTEDNERQDLQWSDILAGSQELFSIQVNHYYNVTFVRAHHNLRSAGNDCSRRQGRYTKMKHARG